MMYSIAWLRVLGVCVMFVLALPSLGQVPREVLDNGKAATGLVLRSGNTGSGTCFCIDPRGYFITNEHVVAGAEGLTIVMSPSSQGQYILTAEVVGIDHDSDLALLKVDLGDHQPGVLLLSEAPAPRETEQLIAFGFPFGDLLAFNDEYPAVSVNIGRVTSLRMRDGELHAIQTDTALNFGNSGGPMLDQQGRVAGIVVAGLPGTGINFAIPVKKLWDFLKTPRIVFGGPGAIAYKDRYEPVELTLGLEVFKPADEPYNVTVEIESEGQFRSYPAQVNREGDYVVSVPPAVRAELIDDPASTLEVEIAFANSRVACAVDDFEVTLDDQAIMLSEILLIDRRKPEVRIVMVDGSEMIGQRLQAGAVAVDLGGASAQIDVTQAQWLMVNRPDPPEASGFAIALKVSVSLGEQELAVGRYDMRVLDPVDIDLPNLAGDFAEQPELPGNALVFDAARDKKLAGWDADFTLPQASGGALVIAGQRDATLTYTDQIELERISLEFETADRGQAFSIIYGDNVYRIHVSENYLGFTHAEDSYGRRLEARAEADLKGRKRITIEFPSQGVTSVSVGQTKLMARRRSGGDLRIRFDSQDAVKIYRIELVPRGDEIDQSMVSTGSDYSPPQGVAGVTQDNAVIELPDEFAAVEVGGGGRYMLFHIPATKSIEIVDIVQGAVVHTMDNVSDDVLMAAGLEHFVLVLPGQKIIQKWSFEGFERQQVARLPGEGQTRIVLLGANSTGPILLGSDQTMFVDLPSLRQIEVFGDTIGKIGTDTYGSADNSTFGATSGGGYRRIYFDGVCAWSDNIGEQGYAGRWAKPSADGKLIFCLNGRFFDHATNEIPVDWLSDFNSYPTVDPRYFIAVGFVEPKKQGPWATQISICTTADRKIIDTIVGIPEMAPSGNTNEQNHTRRLLRDGQPMFHYVPWADALVTLRWDRRSVRVMKVDLTARLESQGGGYLFVESAPPVYASLGGRVSYQVRLQSSSEIASYDLLDGPEGVAVSEKGLVTWDVPDRHVREKETIIISIRNQAGAEVLHAFDLTYR